MRELDHVLAPGCAAGRHANAARTAVHVEAADVADEVGFALPARAASDRDRASGPATKGKDGDATAAPAGEVASGALPLRDAVDRFKRALVARALADTNGSWLPDCGPGTPD